jgi:hypothetical protein
LSASDKRKYDLRQIAGSEKLNGLFDVSIIDLGGGTQVAAEEKVDKDPH